MNDQQAARIAGGLPEDARVVDVGGGAAPFWRADVVLDAIEYEAAGRLAKENGEQKPVRYSRDTWVQRDLCAREPWPFSDDEFDYAVCSHLLEDVRDPIWICSELSRIARAGYIEVPSRYVEQSRGVEHPRFAGYYHHRWLISSEQGELQFRHKPHSLHAIPDAIVADVGIRRAINPRYEVLTIDWLGSIDCREVLEFDEQRVVDELCSFAAASRSVPDLVVPRGRPLREQVKRAIYFRRLTRGGRP